jgi:hypothetical protein
MHYCRKIVKCFLKNFPALVSRAKAMCDPHFCSMSASTPRDGKVAPVSEQRQLGIQLPLVA